MKHIFVYGLVGGMSQALYDFAWLPIFKVTFFFLFLFKVRVMFIVETLILTHYKKHFGVRHGLCAYAHILSFSQC